ncbi:hypothetical protein TNCV_5013151 [Trichonephila clavipes]|nr:hypothetical protein TNCV_5013151 [Trichonephila clavipes]
MEKDIQFPLPRVAIAEKHVTASRGKYSELGVSHNQKFPGLQGVMDDRRHGEPSPPLEKKDLHYFKIFSALWIKSQLARSLVCLRHEQFTRLAISRANESSSSINILLPLGGIFSSHQGCVILMDVA